MREDRQQAEISRRTFLAQTAVASTLAATATLPAWARRSGKELAVSTRKLGKSGLRTTVLGMGTGTRAWNKDSEQIRQGKQLFVDTLVHAYGRGIRFFDLADMYGSHEYMNKALKQGKMDRGRLMIMSKSTSKDAESMRKDMERFRQEIGTDYIDLVLLHCMTSANWAEELKPCMDVLSDAKAKGHIRAHGVSCHDLGAMKTAMTHPWVDVMLNRINPFTEKMDGTMEEVVEVLKTGHANGKGMLGMKICGEGKYADRMRESVKFVLGLGYIDAITIGFLKPGEIDGAIDNIEMAMA